MSLTPDRIEWLTTRPWYTEAHQKVNAYLQTVKGSTQLVAHPSDSDEVTNLLQILESGTIPLTTKSSDQNTIFYQMAQSECHTNSAALVKESKAVYWACGFALSKDMLWRHHSWAVKFDGKIIETTEQRIIYVECTIAYAKDLA